MKRRIKQLAVIAIAFAIGSKPVMASDMSGTNIPNEQIVALKDQAALEAQAALNAQAAAQAAILQQQLLLQQQMEQQAKLQAIQEQQNQQMVLQDAQREALINMWFADAGFVGNSVSVGLKSYFNSKGKEYLSNPKVIATVSYSFQNDKKGKPKFRLSYNGFTGEAKDVIARSGIKKAFINMGTNDLFSGVNTTYDRYVEYVNGIRAANPGIMIFIEATTPVYSEKEKGALTNENVDKLNALMKTYCDANPDMFFIDINTPLKDKSGGLNPAYSSDKYVHVNNAGYKVWIDTVVAAVGGSQL